MPAIRKKDLLKKGQKVNQLKRNKNLLMNRILVSVLLVLGLFVQAKGQSLTITENEPVLMYSLPKTELVLQIEVEKTVSKPGVFYPYSERYLATNQIITKELTKYSLKKVSIFTRTIADPKRTFTIQPVKKSFLNKLTVNNQGILCGLNVPVENTNKFPLTFSSKCSPEKSESASLLPLGEEYMMAGSVAKLAEGAAKQIYRLRESRLSLLTGDLEHMPADGASTKAMLDGLNASEKELTELFIGSVSKSTQYHTVVISPDSVLNNFVAFRISSFKGFVDADDLSGNPYYLQIECQKLKVNPAVAKAADYQTFYNVLPATCKVKITDGVTELASQQTEIPQLGNIVPFQLEILKSDKQKVYVDPATGRFLRIED
jgi:hypothetical protein